MNTAGFPSSRRLPAVSFQAALHSLSPASLPAVPPTWSALIPVRIPRIIINIGDIEHGGIRTHDLCLRRAALYPAELRVRFEYSIVEKPFLSIGHCNGT